MLVGVKIGKMRDDVWGSASQFTHYDPLRAHNALPIG